MGGNPAFRGTRVPVHMLAELVPSRVRAHALPEGKCDPAGLVFKKLPESNVSIIHLEGRAVLGPRLAVIVESRRFRLLALSCPRASAMPLRATRRLFRTGAARARPGNG